MTIGRIEADITVRIRSVTGTQFWKPSLVICVVQSTCEIVSSGNHAIVLRGRWITIEHNEH